MCPALVMFALEFVSKSSTTVPCGVWYVTRGTSWSGEAHTSDSTSALPEPPLARKCAAAVAAAWRIFTPSAVGFPGGEKLSVNP